MSIQENDEGNTSIDGASPEGRPHQCQGEKALRDAVPNLHEHESCKFSTNLDGILMPVESIANAFSWLADGKEFSSQWKEITQDPALTDKKDNWTVVHRPRKGTDGVNETLVARN